MIEKFKKTIRTIRRGTEHKVSALISEQIYTMKSNWRERFSISYQIKELEILFRLFFVLVLASILGDTPKTFPILLETKKLHESDCEKKKGVWCYNDIAPHVFMFVLFSVLIIFYFGIIYLLLSVLTQI